MKRLIGVCPPKLKFEPALESFVFENIVVFNSLVPPAATCFLIYTFELVADIIAPSSLPL